MSAVFVKWHLRWNQLCKLIANIAKGHFLISLLWLCMKECVQVKPYKCSLCEMIFKTRSVLQTHIVHIAKRHILIFTLTLHERMFIGETFWEQSMWDDKKIESVLQTHIAHIAKRHFMISILWLWLKEWMQMIEYECSLCEMTFKMKPVRQTHCKHCKGHFLISFLWLCMKECVQVKPYKCSLCEMAFKMK